jgi:MinD-like ATPase involved in chromosome partitioning or flagellar assembly
VDLPTYTNIWRIEKRLYKLYDFRLPMPLPVGQIAVFLVIAVPYILILSLLGLPFSHTLVWVYVLPPGVLAWLTTRPVLEGKRLPELVTSQVRYLLEPRTWCRMSPLAEKDEIIVFCRVWRQAAPDLAALGTVALEATTDDPAEPALAGEPARQTARRQAARRQPTRRPRPAPQPLAIAPRPAPPRRAPSRPARPRAVARGQAGLGAQASRAIQAQGVGSPGHARQDRAGPGWPVQDPSAPSRPDRASAGWPVQDRPARDRPAHDRPEHDQSAPGWPLRDPSAPGRSSRGEAPRWPRPQWHEPEELPAQPTPVQLRSAGGPDEPGAPVIPGEVVPPRGAAPPLPEAAPPLAPLPVRPARSPADATPGGAMPGARPPADAESLEAQPSAHRESVPGPSTTGPASAERPGAAPPEAGTHETHSAGAPVAAQSADPQSAAAQSAGAVQPGAAPSAEARHEAGLLRQQRSEATPPASQSPTTQQPGSPPAAARPAVAQVPEARSPGDQTSLDQPSAGQPSADRRSLVQPDEAQPAGAALAAGEGAPASDRPGAVPPAGAPPLDPGPPQRPARPVVRVTGERPGERPLRVVERALRSQPGQRPDGWREHVVIVPGGHRPGKPDQLQRDRARARLAVSGPRRIVVLGCTRGAGQTMTALLAADILAALRAEPVAVLDLNPGRGSLTERAAALPGLILDPPEDAAPADPVGRPAGSGLQVISAGAAAPGADDAGRILDLVSARYQLTLADPAAGCVPGTLEVADQLVIVAPASAQAANALAMTFEWLEAHGHRQLADSAVTVLNGVSRPTVTHVEHAANVASGRCRAIVKVPWDNQLKSMTDEHAATAGAAAEARDAPPVLAAPVDPRSASALSPALTRAYTALAGVLIAGLAEPGELRSAPG